MDEFSLKFGTLRKGLTAAVIASLKFLLLPVLILSILMSMGEGASDEVLQTWSQLFADWRMYFLMFSPAIVGLAFMYGFYWKGSYSRAIMGIFKAPVMATLGYMLILGGGLQAAMDSVEVEMDLMLPLYLMLVMIGFGLLFIVGEFYDYRMEYRQKRLAKLGQPPLPDEPREDPELHRWSHDFKLRYGLWSSGFKAARKSFSGYILWPMLLFAIIAAVLVRVNDALPVDLSTEMMTVSGMILLVGLVLVALSFFKGFYPKGSVSRMTFWLFSVAVICWWLWTITMGGKMVLDVADMITLNVNYQTLVLLFMLVASLWGVYAVAEYFSYRNDWAENDYRPVKEEEAKRNKELRKARLKAEKEAAQ